MAEARTQAEIDADEARYAEIRQRHFKDFYRPLSQQPQAQEAQQAATRKSKRGRGPGYDQQYFTRSVEPQRDRSSFLPRRTRWERQLRKQLRAIIGQPSPDLEILFFEALAIATPDRAARELVVDVHALIRTFTYVLGEVWRSSRNAGDAGSRHWPKLARWIESHVAPVTHPDPDGIDARWVAAEQFDATLSISVREQLLPALARQSGTSPAGTRHLVRYLADGQVDEKQLFASGWRANLEETRELADLLDSIEREDGDALRAAAERQFTPPGEETPVLEDRPALVDQLGRKPVATVVAERLRAVWPALARDRQALIVHLHGPWGSGKSSILNFLKADLVAGPEPWLVVEFNAWRNARVHPPWWSLVRETRRAVSSLGLRHRLRVEWEWLWWRVRMDWLIAAGAGLLLAVLIGAAATGLIENVNIFGKDGLIGALGGVAALVGALLLLNRTLVLGSKGASDALDALRADAAGPVAELFCSLVKLAGRPVILYLDDLDRCSPQQVTDLLEGVQTLFRDTACVFVAVGDRAWLCEAFELKYAAYAKVIGEPGRPMGYLFLDKLFQISVGVPAFTPAVRKAYLARLLGRGGDRAALSEADAGKRIAAAGSHEAIVETIAQAPEAEKPALRAAAAAREGKTQVQADIEHRLEPLAGLMEANPRAMKQVVNAIGLNRARMWLEGREVPFDVLARFTILELRWPAIAVFLAADPARAGDARGWPADFQLLLADPAFVALLGAAGDAGQLGPAAIEALRGQAIAQ